MRLLLLFLPLYHLEVQSRRQVAIQRVVRPAGVFRVRATDGTGLLSRFQLSLQIRVHEVVTSVAWALGYLCYLVVRGQDLESF